MNYYSSVVLSLLTLSSTNVNYHVSSFTTTAKTSFHSPTKELTSSALSMAFGLGPKQLSEEEQANYFEQEQIDYAEPDHELFRKSRLTKIDQQADDWFASLLGNVDNGNDSMDRYPLGDVSKNVMKRILTPIVLQQDPLLPEDHPDWRPKALIIRVLPWKPIVPAYGLETYGLPVPRRGAEAWRHFDLPGMLATDYSLDATNKGLELKFKSDEEEGNYKEILMNKGYWLNDEQCEARLIYINGQYCPSLSKHTDTIQNLQPSDFATPSKVRNEILTCLEHLPDGHTDELPTEEGQPDITTLAGSNKISRLSGPNHHVGNATSQYAINNQQGTAIWSALNSVKTSGVALVDIPEGIKYDLPILVVNAWTNDGGVVIEDGEKEEEDKKGVTIHPRLLVIAGKGSKSSVIQGTIDLEDADDASISSRPKFYNGYSQLYLRANSKVSHSYLEESGGYPTPRVELRNNDKSLTEGEQTPQEIESNRPALQNSHFEMIDMQATGENATYKHTGLGMGGNGRSRVSMCTSLHQRGASAELNGFSLAGGAQRADVRTTIHHIGPDTTSRQMQKTMVGGRATTLFKGRIRVEQKAIGTDNEQLSRTIMLSDASKVWAIPSLEIVPAELKCSHGATVSDMSDEELFYLRSRGFDRLAARKLLMTAFLQECSRSIAPEILGTNNAENSLALRISKRLTGLIPTGDRAWKKDYQSV